MKINLLLIATKKYHIYVQPLLEGVKKYFLVNHQIEVHIFTDTLDREYIGDDRVKITQELIPSYGFPLATLYRYKIFCSKRYTGDFIYYSDVDMDIVDFVGEEIFGDIVAVKHPGYAEVGGGSWEDRKESCVYTYPVNRVTYYAGGFQGGSCERYYRLMERMKRDIDEDEKNGIIPVWHDETVWNFYIGQMRLGTVTELNPSYCMVEQPELQKKWKIDHFPKRIIALSKNHNEIRS